jgi:hypothetical protein
MLEKVANESKKMARFWAALGPRVDVFCPFKAA